MNRNVRVSLLSAAVLSTALASADVISPEESACNGHSAGDACILPAGTAGRCTSRTLPVGNPAADASRTGLFCVASDGGTTPSDSGQTPPPSSSSGCSVGGRGRGRGRASDAGATVFGLAVAMLAARRRRRAP